MIIILESWAYGRLEKRVLGECPSTNVSSVRAAIELQACRRWGRAGRDWRMAQDGIVQHGNTVTTVRTTFPGFIAKEIGGNGEVIRAV